MLKSEYQYENPDLFGHNNGQTGQPAYSSDILLFFFFFAAEFLVLFQGTDH